MKKIKLLAVSDWIDSGFGRVMKELLPRLAATGLFEIEMVAWCYTGDPDVYDAARRYGVRLHPAWGRDWGAQIAGQVAKKFDPDIVFTLGDPWMVDWMLDFKYRDKVKWICYVPIDRAVVPQSWIRTLSKPDVTVLYSEFGRKILDRNLPFQINEMIYHGVDSTNFKPADPAINKAGRRNIQLQGDEFIVGCVARNQERKRIARMLMAYKAWNCTCCLDRSRRVENPAMEIPIEDWYDCPLCGNFQQDPDKETSKIYLHMTMGDGSDPQDQGTAWNVHEMVYRLNLRNRILATPRITVRKGLPSNQLALIYNLFDVHFLGSKREGFGLPILEAMASGVPNICTNYSSMVELVEQGGGLLMDVETYINDPHDEADGAIFAIDSAVDCLERYYRDPDLRKQHAEQGRRFAEQLDWNNFIPAWTNLFFRSMGLEAPDEVQTFETQPPKLNLVTATERVEPAEPSA